MPDLLPLPGWAKNLRAFLKANGPKKGESIFLYFPDDENEKQIILTSYKEGGELELALLKMGVDILKRYKAQDEKQTEQTKKE